MKMKSTKVIHRMRTQGWHVPGSDFMMEQLPHEIDFRYEIGEILGEGGYGTVRSGINKLDRNEVAIKIFERSVMDEHCIMNEINILQSLDHPNIVHAYDFFKTADKFYIIEEKITGGELFDRIVEKQTYTEVEARQALLSILKATKYCHDRHVVHRDIKPENLLYTSRASNAPLKLVDFGFATVIKDGEYLSDQCGTPSYMAPEVICKRPYGKAVDMWAIGVILYILLAGSLPFNDKDQLRLYDKIRTAKFEFPDSQWSCVSGEAISLVKNLLCLDPCKRFTCDEALSASFLRSSSCSMLGPALKNLKSFQARKRWKISLNAILATNRLRLLSRRNSEAFIMEELSYNEGVFEKVGNPLIDSYFTIEEVICEGANAIVRAGTRKIDNCEVAIKVFSQKKLYRKKHNYAKNELEILRLLDHPNIVLYVDCFEESDKMYLVLERISGGALLDRVVQRQFYPENEARVIFHVLMRAVYYLHENHIAHRNLKLENILFTSSDCDTTLKIVDFGYAAHTEGFKLTGQFGQLAYTAPEMIMKIEYGLPVDMWSCGVILYILLGGYEPFHDDDQGLLEQRIAQGVFAFHEDYWHGISEDAQDLISGLLTVNPLFRTTAEEALMHPWFTVLGGDDTRFDELS